MATKKARINITCEQETLQLLTDLAKKQDRSTAGLAKELILEALEMREDILLAKLVQTRDIVTTTRISHDSVWQEYISH